MPDFVLADDLGVGIDRGTIEANKLNPVRATDTVTGAVRLATNAEAIAGTATDVAVTPAQISGATDRALTGLQSYNPATNVATFNMSDGSTVDVDFSALITDTLSSLPSASDTAAGTVELATNAETTTGTATNLAATPAGVGAAIAGITGLSTGTYQINNAFGLPQATVLT